MVLADHPVSILNEIKEQVENLRPNPNRLRGPHELTPVGIKDTICEQELHVGNPETGTMFLKYS